MDERILAAVVTHHPGPELAENLQALRRQGAEVLVIDNGSPDFAAIERAANASGCQTLRNADNLGVAAALNQAARAAQAGAYAWLAMFDQDSWAPDGALAELLALYAAHPARQRVAILAMSHRDRAMGRGYARGSDVLEQGSDWRSLRATITSGSLVRVAVFDRVGLFDERLFIDGVDHDFCLRCRRAGLLVVEGRPVLEHALGAVTTHRLLGRTIACTNHAPSRRYYITRNSLEISARHGAGDWLWSVRNLAHLADSNLTALVFEDHRAAKAAAMLQGAWHFAVRRFGPRPCQGRPRRAT
ncbi:MAG TPA: glycosyltransferase [Caulobacteraceae bacterium]